MDFALDLEKPVTRVFDSGKPGPVVLVTGAVHGNEKCGTLAIKRFIEDFESGALTLSAGKVVFVPVVNRLAYTVNQHFIETNLNRVFEKHGGNPDTLKYEEAVASEMAATAENLAKESLQNGHRAVWLDLHSYHTPGGAPFTFLDYETPENMALVRAAGVKNYATGWGNIYQDGEPASTDLAHKLGMDTILVECGGHNDAGAPFVASQAIGNILIHKGMIDGVLPAVTLQQSVFEQKIIKEDGLTMAKDWRHLDPVQRGDLLATYGDGREIRAEKDGVILLPFKDAKDGAELFYIGRQEKAPPAPARPATPLAKKTPAFEGMG